MTAADDFAKQLGTIRNLALPQIRDPLAHLHRQMEDVGKNIKPLAAVIAEEAADREKRRSAGTVVGHILKQVRDFEASLDANQEVAIHLVNFGQSLTIRIASIGYIEPAIILFTGVNDDGEEVRLVQHIHQLSFLLWKAPRLNPDEPRRAIGFVSETDTEK